LCAVRVDRGEPCARAEGKFCHDEDVCSPTDPSDPMSELRCHQRCDDPGVACAEGSCTNLNGIKYCR
jgi:hypothetical protein